MRGSVKPEKHIHPSGEYAFFYCPLCEANLGAVDLTTGEWIIEPRSCPNGHEIDWNTNRRLHNGITGTNNG